MESVKNISDHFTLAEMTRTDTGLPNKPDSESLRNLQRLCLEVLEPIRLLLGVPLLINSGYRSRPVNSKVRGASDSRHLRGLAADFHPVSPDPIREAFRKIRISTIPFEKLILEFHGPTAWIHVEAPADGAIPAKKCYIATVTDSATVYKPVTA